jgi:hypothetical protein
MSGAMGTVGGSRQFRAEMVGLRGSHCTFPPLPPFV